MHRVMLDKAAGRHRKSRQKQKKESKEKKKRGSTTASIGTDLSNCIGVHQ